METIDRHSIARPGACRYEFGVKRRAGERARLIITCHLPSGLASRMDIDEADLPEFVRGFIDAVRPISSPDAAGAEMHYLSV